MKQTLYVSDPAGGSTQPHLPDILRCSRRNNPELGITGLLVARETMFVQLIEGPDDYLASVIDIIRADTRHANVRVLSVRNIAVPSFGDWAMGYVSGSGSDPWAATLGNLVNAAVRTEIGAATALLQHLLPVRPNMGREYDFQAKVA